MTVNLRKYLKQLLYLYYLVVTLSEGTVIISQKLNGLTKFNKKKKVSCFLIFFLFNIYNCTFISEINNTV
jgi:hypothetical protein